MPNQNYSGGGTNPSPTGSGTNWPAIIGGASVLGNIATQAMSNRQRRILEEQTRAWNLEQWHRQNRYNHPLEQMARLRAAGLNPNLIYGSSPGSAVGNASTVHPGKAPEYKLTDPIGPGANLFMDTRVKQAQTDNMKADVVLKGTQSLKTATEAGIKGRELDKINATFDELVGTTKLDFAIKGIQYDVAKGLKPHQIASAQSNAEKNRLAALLMTKDLEYAQQGFVKGNYIGTIMKGVFNLDMTNPTDRKVAQGIVASVLASQLASGFTAAFRNTLQAFAKKPPITIIK